ncbi:MAG: hypothetical protein HZA53_13345 [Planctomycetes bacterium]|nr:hypothetical protein [Planctomycetota bacterium]
MRTAPALVTLLLLALPAPPLHASGHARFDGLVEGLLGPVVVDGGITFSNYASGVGWFDFSCEDASTDFSGFAGFTPPNVLGFQTWSPGGGVGFARILSFEFTTGQLESTASLDLYAMGDHGGNVVTLEAWQGTVLTGSRSFPLPTALGVFHLQPSIAGVPFDRIVVRGSGPWQQGAFFACVDDVIVGGTPRSGAFCFGDGIDPAVTVACPCGNFGAAGNGCANSVNANGALLAVTGEAATDDVVLHASGMPATVSCIFLQGTQVEVAVFGDGVRCVGGTLLRLRTRSNVGGASQFPDSTDTVTLAQRGGVTIGSGVVRFYQTYYRNSAPLHCPPDTFNVTNGAAVTW